MTLTREERSHLKQIVSDKLRASSGKPKSVGFAMHPEDRYGLDKPGQKSIKTIPLKDWPDLFEWGFVPYEPISKHFTRKFGWYGAEQQFASSRRVWAWREQGYAQWDAIDRMFSNAGMNFDWHTSPELDGLYASVSFKHVDPRLCDGCGKPVSQRATQKCRKCHLEEMARIRDEKRPKCSRCNGRVSYGNKSGVCGECQAKERKKNRRICRRRGCKVVLRAENRSGNKTGYCGEHYQERQKKKYLRRKVKRKAARECATISKKSTASKAQKGRR